MSYQPRCIPTAHLASPAPLLDLIEFLAENTHEVWAQRRLAEGWTYGPRRDEAEKVHPGLVPYAELCESEKDYDRSTALETLKAILSLGYRIVAPP
jgi:hypothetical protein